MGHYWSEMRPDDPEDDALQAECRKIHKDLLAYSPKIFDSVSDLAFVIKPFRKYQEKWDKKNLETLKAIMDRLH